MSGHSKWSTIKHRKAAQDKVRGNLFAKLLRQVEAAAREGGGDVEANPTLRGYVQKCKDASIPNDNVERAVRRGTGALEGVRYEAVTYEGYAPNGVAMYVECLTDNRNRTAQEVKAIFTRNGGSLAEPGAVAWQFERKGVIVVDKTAGVDEDALVTAAIEAGADDIDDQGDTWEVTTPPGDLVEVRSALDGAGVPVVRADLTMLPTNTVPLSQEEGARAVLRVLDALDDLDDVQAVYANFDIPDEVLQVVGG